MNYRDYSPAYADRGSPQFLVVDAYDRVVYVARGKNEAERIDDASDEQRCYPYPTRVYRSHAHYGQSGFVSVD